MKNTVLIIPILLIILVSCHDHSYNLNDFQKIEKMDAHFHIYGKKNPALEQALRDRFRLLCINTNSEDCERVQQAQGLLDSLKNGWPDAMEYSATFCMDRWDEPDWTKNTIEWIDSCIDQGAVAVKVWKNIGMEFREQNNNLVMIDNPRFDPVFKHLAEKGIPMAGHLGEPKNCWLPLEKMSVKNDSNYFSKHPEYHMYLHPELPSYKEQMSARDRMLEKNPDLTFIGCHLASLEWSVDTLARFLDHFPNAAVDMSARMGQLFFQTRDDRAKVRRFFIDYQDRLLYGTDITDNGEGNPENFMKRLHETWLRDWEYFVTDNEITSPLIRGSFRGLKLPKSIVDKIYLHNTVNWYKLGEE